MKPQYFIFIFVLTKDLKHNLTEVPLLEMINETSTEGRCVSLFCKDLNFNTIVISHTCRKNDLEICAVELKIEAPK